MKGGIMIKSICSFILLACVVLFAHSGDTLDVHYGTRPVIDGLISAGEWDDADTVITDNLPDGPAIIYYKEFPETLYMAISISDVTYADFDNAALYFDTLHNGGSAPQPDDIGCATHRGGMWVEFYGNGSGWNNQTPSGWYGALNTNASGWTIEFAISYNKLGLAMDVPKTLGFCARIGDQGNGGVGWPSGVDRNVPDTWADIYSSENWGQGDTVSPQVTVVLPDGGENWIVGSMQAILWIASDNVQVDSVNIYYSTNAGGSWLVVATGESNDSTYIWTVPNTPSDSCLVQIYAFDRSGNWGSDISDDVFTITTVGIEEKSTNVHNNKSIVHTNPSKTGVWFYNIPPGLVTLTVYDVIGKKVYENQSVVKDDKLFWKTDSKSGVYFYILKTQIGERKGKILLLR